MPRSFVSKSVNRPGSKTGLRLTRAKYAPVRQAILRALPQGGDGMTFADLVTRVAEDLKRQRVPGDFFRRGIGQLVRQGGAARPRGARRVRASAPDQAPSLAQTPLTALPPR